MHALHDLRARIGTLEKRSRETIPWSCLEGGLLKGGLVEITGAGKTGAVAKLLAESNLPTAWVESNFSVFPTALVQRQVNLEKIFFVEGGRDCSWAATTILRSQLFSLLVYSAPYGEERELRRFQLLAERAKTTMLLLAPIRPTLAWPISLCLEMRSGSCAILRRK